MTNEELILLKSEMENLKNTVSEMKKRNTRSYWFSYTDSFTKSNSCKIKRGSKRIKRSSSRKTCKKMGDYNN